MSDIRVIPPQNQNPFGQFTAVPTTENYKNIAVKINEELKKKQNELKKKKIQLDIQLGVLPATIMALKKKKDKHLDSYLAANAPHIMKTIGSYIYGDASKIG